MSSYVKSENSPTWTSGSGIYRDTVTGPCILPDGQSYVRKYNKIGNFLGVPYVAKKDQYEIGILGRSGSTFRWVGKYGTDKETFDTCFNYALEMQNIVPEELPEELPEESYRPPNVGADVPVEFIIGGIIGVVTIIYAVK